METVNDENGIEKSCVSFRLQVNSMLQKYYVISLKFIMKTEEHACELKNFLEATLAKMWSRGFTLKTNTFLFGLDFN